MSSVGKSFDVRGMNSKGTYYRSTGQSLGTELRSWNKNKMEDRRLAQNHDMVDRHMLIKRKTHMQERDKLNKEMTEKICKTTPTADEYLDKSYHRYSGWRARERERLDRRYNGLYKSYLKDFSGLDISDDLLKAARRKKNVKDGEEEDTGESESAEDAEATAEEENDLEDLIAMETLNIGRNRRRFSVANVNLSSSLKRQKPKTTDINARRGSTGTVLLPSDLQTARLRSGPGSSSSLQRISEGTGDDGAAVGPEVTPDTEGTPPSTPDSDTPSQPARRTGRRASAGDILQQLSTSKRLSRAAPLVIPMYDGKN